MLLLNKDHCDECPKEGTVVELARTKVRTVKLCQSCLQKALALFPVDSVKTLPPNTCPKCQKGEMKPSKAIQETTVGYPDFVGDTSPVTMSAGGPGKLIDCLKCNACGYSET